MSARVWLVDDHEVVRRGVADMLNDEPDLEVVGESGSVAEALAYVPTESPDVVVVDVRLPDGNGIELIRSVSAKKPDCDIMVVTVFGDEQHVVSSIEAGATGYILKDSTPADVISCIRLLRAGGSPVSPVVARSVLRDRKSTRLNSSH